MPINLCSNIHTHTHTEILFDYETSLTMNQQTMVHDNLQCMAMVCSNIVYAAVSMYSGVVGVGGEVEESGSLLVNGSSHSSW